MATLVETTSKKNKWKVVIRKKGWPTVAKSFRLKEDAKDWARRTEDEMVRSVYVQRASADQTTLKAALERYVQEITPLKAESTQKSELRHAAFLAKHLGKYTLATLTQDVIAKHRDRRLSGELRPDGSDDGIRAGSTVRQELALLSHLFSVAIKEWRIGLAYNPCLAVRKPKAAPSRHRRLTADEERRVLAEVDRHSNPMLGWIARLALETAMRSSEITSIRRSQIDLNKRVVILHKTKNKSPREVPLSNRALEVLHAALANQVRPSDTDLLFFGEPGKDGKRRPYVFEKLWAQAKERAGIQDFHFHDLRHEAASRLAEGGMDARKIAAILGHKDMKMAMVYVNLYGRDLVDEVNHALDRRRARGLG